MTDTIKILWAFIISEGPAILFFAILMALTLYL